MNKVLLLFAFLTLSISLSAQYAMGLAPRLSPDAGVYKKIGYTEIDIKYGAPSVAERAILGNLIPYDKVWRAGANSATTIEFNTDVQIENQKLNAGKYAFFVLAHPGKSWELIFSKKASQWGSFRYKEEEDALRVEVLPTLSNEHTEQLSYFIENEGYEKGFIGLRWGSVELKFAVSMEFFAGLQMKVNEFSQDTARDIKNQWAIYLQGAELLLDKKIELKQAMSWINLSEKSFAENKENQGKYTDYFEGEIAWLKAKILAANGDLKAARQYAQSVIKNKAELSFYKKEKEDIDFKGIMKGWK